MAFAGFGSRYSGAVGWGEGALVATGHFPRLAPQVTVAKTRLFAGREAVYDSNASGNLSHKLSSFGKLH